jgi:hypothetical protein
MAFKVHRNNRFNTIYQFKFKKTIHDVYAYEYI